MLQSLLVLSGPWQLSPQKKKKKKEWLKYLKWTEFTSSLDKLLTFLVKFLMISQKTLSLSLGRFHAILYSSIAECKYASCFLLSLWFLSEDYLLFLGKLIMVREAASNPATRYADTQD